MLKITLSLQILVFLGSLASSQAQLPTEWMEGKHGIGFRIPGGVNYETAAHTVTDLIQQIKTEIPEISWVLFGYVLSCVISVKTLAPLLIISSLSHNRMLHSSDCRAEPTAIAICPRTPF